MTDISKEAVERLADEMDRQVQKICGTNSKEAQTLRAQAARIEQLEADRATMEDSMHTLLDRQPVLQAKAREDALRNCCEAADKLGHHCIGCGHLCGDPEKDLANIRKHGAISCCPERKMEPLSAAILALINKEPKP